MKLADFSIEFITHCLANGNRDGEDCDKFIKDKSGALIFQQSWFYSAFEKAIQLCKFKSIKPGDISVKLAVTADTKIFNRKYNIGSEARHRSHEAIYPGTVVNFEAIVDDHITESMFKKLLEYTGTYVGISPYGYNLGYGKFSVLTVKVQLVDE